MTQPANAKQRGDDRYYTLDGDPNEYLSVTTVISRGKPKNLNNWLRKTTAEYAVDNIDTWRELSRDEAIGRIAQEANRLRDAAGSRGDDAHSWLEQRMRGQKPSIELVDPAAHIYIEAVERFIGECAPRPVELERTVRHPEHGYAGSFDGIYRLHGWDGLTLIDAKTSSGIFDEVALQLAAYRYAPEFTVDGEWYSMPTIDRCAVLWIRPGCDRCDLMAGNPDAAAGVCPKCGSPLVGRYELVEIDAGPEAYATFLACLEVAKWSTDGWRGFKRSKYRPPRDLHAELRHNLVERISGLDGQAREQLAGIWPQGVGTLRNQPRHSKFELDLIDQAVAHVETQVGAPFNPPPLPSLPGTIAHTAKVADVEEPAPQTIADRVMARIDRLPHDLKSAVTANLVGKVPNLRTGRATYTHIDMIDRELAAAEHEHNNRVAQLTSALAPLEADEHAAICAVVGCPVDVHAIGQMHAEQVIELAGQYGQIITASFDDDGDMVLNVAPHALDALVEAYGGKASLLAAAKHLNDTHQLGLSFRSSAEAVEDPRLAALAAGRV